VQQALVQHESPIVLPPLLAAVLGSINRLDEFDDRLLEVREKAAPLRRRIGEIEEALRGTDLAVSAKTERQLFAAFATDAKLFSSDLGSMWPTLTTTAGTITSATTGQSPWITGAMALLTAASTVSPQRINAVRDRLTRRHLWFVTELGGWCDSIHDATPQLRRLWRPAAGADFDHAFHEQLERVRRLGYA
jgi:hypothetical protein